VAYIPIGLLWLFGVSAATIVFNIITLCRCRELAMDIFAPLLARGLLWILGIRVRVRGTEYLPTRGGPTGPSALKSTQVIICNHTSFLDAMAICAVCPHAMYYVAKKEIVYFPVLGWAWWILAQGMISRSNKTAARSTMDTLRDDCIAADAKRRPRQVIFFPRGDEKPDRKAAALQERRLPPRAAVGHYYRADGGARRVGLVAGQAGVAFHAR
jgi:1-acyl-sn-glycerol-3-phosphate acyltransferase